MAQNVLCGKHTGLYGKGPVMWVRTFGLTEGTLLFVVG
jgi:hypothetical protein